MSNQWPAAANDLPAEPYRTPTTRARTAEEAKRPIHTSNTNDKKGGRK